MKRTPKAATKTIWFAPVDLSKLKKRGESTLVEHLGIEITEVGFDFIRATMPVDDRTRQPIGILHGGASLALAESLASVAGNLVVNSKSHYAVGLEINANHIRSCRDGVVQAEARPAHLGRTTHVWEIRISQGESLLCLSRMTLAILARKT